MTDDAEGRKQYDDRDFAKVYETVFGQPGKDGVTHRLLRTETMIADHIQSCEKRYKAEQEHRERDEERRRTTTRWIVGLVFVGLGHLIAVWAILSKVMA